MIRCNLWSRIAPLPAAAIAVPVPAILRHFASTVGSSPEPPSTERQLAQVRAAAANVTAYMNLHKSNVNMPKPRVALQAWREMQELPESYIEIADVDSVVKMLGAIAYFRGVWEKGHDGPANPLPVRQPGKRLCPDPEDIAIPPDFYRIQSVRSRTTGDGARYEQTPQGANSGSQQQRRSGTNSNAAAAGGQQKRFASRPKPVDVVGQMIE